MRRPLRTPTAHPWFSPEMKPRPASRKRVNGLTTATECSQPVSSLNGRKTGARKKSRKMRQEHPGRAPRRSACASRLRCPERRDDVEERREAEEAADLVGLAVEPHAERVRDRREDGDRDHEAAEHRDHVAEDDREAGAAPSSSAGP